MSPVDVLWASPVTIRLANGQEKSFTSISDALDFMDFEWPSRHGAYHDSAVVACRNALMKMTPPAVAREYFIAACLEAGPRLTTRMATGFAAPAGADLQRSHV